MEMPDRPKDLRRLQGCLRDLVALTAMPASWVGQDRTAIRDSLRDVLARMLNADNVYVQLGDVGGHEARVEARLGRKERRGTTVPVTRWRRPSSASLGESGAAMRLARLPIGPAGELGCFAVGAFRSDFPDRYETLLMRVAASEVAIALRHQALLSRHEDAERLVRARAERQELVARLGLRALHGTSLDETLTEAVVALRDTLHVDYCEVLELAADGQSFVLRCGSGWPSTLTGTMRVSAAPDSMPGFAIRSMEPIVVRDFATDERFDASSLERSRAIVSAVSVIIHAKDTTFGVLAVHSCERRDFTQDDVHLQQSIANLLSAAVQRHAAEAERDDMLARTTAAREEAERASRSKSDLLGMISHEIRTPLNAIVGYVELIEEQVHGPITEDQRRDLARIRRSQQYLLNVIDNVLSFLKLGSGHVRYDIVDIDLDALFATVEELVRPLVRNKQLEYEQRPPPRGTCIHADREKVQQILLNLLSNAVKFTARNGRVRLECSIAGSVVHIHVRDSGSGIPPNELPKVFEPFVRIDSGTAQRVEGTGLGLSISRDFAIGMGGQLVAESELGKGSTFTLTVPRCAVSAVATQRS
jgi:signal transduction histidine kinase